MFNNLLYKIFVMYGQKKVFFIMVDTSMSIVYFNLFTKIIDKIFSECVNSTEGRVIHDTVARNELH